MTSKLTLFLIGVSLAGGFFLEQPRLSPPTQSTGPQPTENAWEEKQLANYLGYENCRKCHQMQVEKLTTTAHFKSFETVHRSARSKEICQAVGIRSIKRDARCIRCHYTPEQSSRGVRAQSGISCESCHGPSKNWIQGHNDYGGLTITKAQESLQHRNFRIESSIEKGMRHPSNLYLLARSCYECHLVDDAELINASDHPPISSGFNMVSWSQGSMRHNFLRTDNQSNAMSSDERLRVMFVVDLLAKIEAILKSQSTTVPDSKHSTFLKNQYIQTAKQLLSVARVINQPPINQVIDILKRTPPDASPESQKAAANQIKVIGFQFGKDEAAHELNAIQNMLPGKEQYR